MIEEIIRIVMQLTGGAFAGACLYIMVAQHPARMELAGSRALDDFRAAIPRAERLQAPLLIACIVAVALDLVLAFSWSTLSGGVLMVAVLAQTIATVLPINRRLLSGAAADHLDVSDTLLTRWGRLHVIRTVISVVGAVLLLI